MYVVCRSVLFASVKWCVLTRSLCEHCVAGKIEGDVRVSGYPKVQETFARIMGYVEQSDIHSPNVSSLPCPPVHIPSCNTHLFQKLMEIWCAIFFFCCTCALGGQSFGLFAAEQTGALQLPDDFSCGWQITVLESLVYSARLRFGKEVERNVVYAFVQEVRLM